MTNTPKSKSFTYVKNQVLLGNFDVADLTVLVSRNIITDKERTELVTFIK